MDNLRDLLDIRRIHGVPNARISVEWYKGWMEELRRVFSNSLAMLKEWRMIRLWVVAS